MTLHIVTTMYHNYCWRCEHDEADRLVDHLLSKGYLYEADGIRLTNGE
jgi:hypothetical protein